jgi:Zn-dependent protease
MNNLTSGSLRLLRVAGIDIYLHWSWLLVAYLQIKHRAREREFGYESPVWYLIEYCALFGIVLLHEFGHALACRQVGGTANQIVLWPLGGVAYVNPPPRPGAFLWSIAAGPLVNLLLVPVTIGLAAVGQISGWDSDLERFLNVISVINLGLLIFNLLPIYPLDGGQILQALLWFMIGRVKSLMVASIVGLVLGVAGLVAALSSGMWWLAIMAGFVVLRSFAGFQQAQKLSSILNGPRHQDAACPSCGQAPFQGKLWICDNCHSRFDTFEHRAVCPVCGEEFYTTMCPLCHARHPMEEWLKAAPPVANDSYEY